MKALGWVLLGLVVLHHKTWGACDCPAYLRRISVQSRELRTWQNEARKWKYLYEHKELT